MARSVASARSAAQQLGSADLAGALSGAEPALPGSRAAEKIGQVRQAWQQRTQSLAQQVRDHAEAIESARSGYEQNEEAAKRDLHAAGAGLGRRPV